MAIIRIQGQKPRIVGTIKPEPYSPTAHAAADCQRQRTKEKQGYGGAKEGKKKRIRPMPSKVISVCRAF